MKTDKNSRTTTPEGTQPKPELTVPDNNHQNKSLKAALLAECHELVRLSEYDAKTGLSFWPHVSKDCNDCGRCTNGAKFIAQKFGGYVAGYEIERTDPQTLVGTDAGGHDFAVVGDFIVDWWGWEYEESLETPVLTRAEGIALGKYKAEQDWKIFPPNDFRPKVESSTPARIPYDKWLEKYRPIKNPFDKAAPYDGCMFETYDADRPFVCCQHPRKIWTLVQCENEHRIYQGFHYVNRLGHFVTEVEAPANCSLSINAD